MDEIFRWESLRMGGRADMRPKGQLVTGRTGEVELTTGGVIEVWRSEDGKEYFCHGLTFGGKSAPGGPVSPYSGVPVERIIHAFFDMVVEAETRPGDILVWSDTVRGIASHSAIVIAPIVDPDLQLLDPSSRLLSKNGFQPESETTLAALLRFYGEWYNAYKRR